jgi:cholest-4-en-3-one 26-monooxygenase
MAHAEELGSVNFWDLDLFGAGIPHELFARLRREEPLAWNESSDAGGGFWSLTRYADVERANRDHETFSSQRRGIMMFDTPTLESPDDARMMIELDPPLHTRYRMLVNRGFTPRMVNTLEAMMRRVAATAVDDVADAERCDFARDVASRLPVAAIADLLGVPERDRPLIDELSERIQRGDENAPAAQAIGELCAYANDLAATKRADLARGDPADDVVKTLLSSTIEGDALSESEFDLFFLLLAVAGNETTRGATTGGMLAFIEHPDQWSRLQADRSLLPTAVEEVLRWSTPIRYMARTATRPVDLYGRTIEPGDKVVLWYASANFDDDAFVDPMRFDIARTPNEHLAFGSSGPHHCLGASLARLELNVLFDEFARRFDAVRIDGPLERMRNSFANAITSMPVTFSLR